MQLSNLQIETIPGTEIAGRVLKASPIGRARRTSEPKWHWNMALISTRKFALARAK
jgi:hypothetical protein